MKKSPPATPSSAELNARERIVLEKIHEFFDDPNRLETLRQVLLEKTVSLRRLESLATSSSSVEEAVISDSYYSWLRAYGKLLFDPFARSKHINFKNMDTSVGQLNFLRWALSQPELVDRAIDERRRRVKRRTVRARETKANVHAFDAKAQIKF